MKIVIVGGVAGGASAAARLRRLDEQAEIILLERGAYISYANCGLPYYIGGEITEKSKLVVQTPEVFSKRFAVDVRTCHEAISIDREARTVAVQNHCDGSTYREGYDKLILSPGAEPVRPPLPGVEDPRIFRLRTVPDTFAIKEFIDSHHPKTAVVVGGGFIGLEMVESLCRQGIAVTLVEMADHLLPTLDYEMARPLQRYLASKGVKLHVGKAVRGFEDKDGCLQVQLDDAELPADMVLLSVGVRPESSLAQKAGLAVGARGGIVTNERLLTNDPNIYAIGDAVEVTHFVSGAKVQIPLAGPANKQGRIVADNICGIASRYWGTQGSAVVRAFDMVAAATGLTETDATAAGLPFDMVYLASPSHATYYPGGGRINAKLLFERESGRVLGAQLVGMEGVDKRCDVLATAIRANLTVFDLTELELCYAPPFSSAKDPVNMMGYAAENIITGKVKQHYWRDWATSGQPDADTILLDVRRDDEWNRAHIEGSVHIPLDELRARMDELPRGKKINVMCQSGQRSYVACRMLSQHGFDCYNCAGGFGLYEDLTRD